MLLGMNYIPIQDHAPKNEDFARADMGRKRRFVRSVQTRFFFYLRPLYIRICVKLGHSSLCTGVVASSLRGHDSTLIITGGHSPFEIK